MSFLNTFLLAFLVIMILMTTLWIISVLIKNASIVDPFWGFGYVLAGTFYYFMSDGLDTRKTILLILVIIWGMRLSIFLGWRNFGKGEDFRYQKFRKDYGEKRYWWFSFFQVFLLQGVLMWIVSVTLLGGQFYQNNLNVIDFIALVVWTIGFVFEAGGDFQMAKFKANPSNKGKVMDKGFWKYTRHPNYFGDAMVWWAFGLFSVAAGSYLPLIGSLVMTILLLKVSGVSLLERTLKDTKPQYKEYMTKTSSFVPWFPKK
jgi:steroid 5-alpha reductase family enzyme